MILSNRPDGDQVLADLGPEFVGSFIDSVHGARHDFVSFREWRPEWFPGFTSRFTANFLHERIWARLVTAVDGMTGIHVVDQEPVREVHSGTRYLIRIKRHREGDRIAAYPTASAVAFWSHRMLPLDGLETFSLALGYLWDPDLRTVGDPVLSFRDGKDDPVWAMRLHRDDVQAQGFSWSPVEPELPGLDLGHLGGTVEEVAR